MQRRRLIVTIPTELYRVLEHLANQDERAVDQQASYLLRRVLRGEAPREMAPAGK